MAARLTANVLEGATYQFGGRQADKEITEEGFLVKKNMAVLSKKQMFFTRAASKNFSHLDVAAPKAAYSVPNYHEYLPIQALDAQQFIDEFYEKHKRTVPKLEKSHIHVAFSVFTCGLELIEEDHIAEHTTEV